MRNLKRVGLTLVLGVVIGAAHFVVTFAALGAIAFSAVSTEPTRVPYAVIELTFLVCSFPLARLPVGGRMELLLLLNSVLWGFLLATVGLWLWSCRKRPLLS